MTRIWLLTDLHLEGLDPGTGDPETWDPGAAPDFDVLACGGDVVERDPAACVDVLARLARGRPVVLALGNHDVWGRSPAEAAALARGRHPDVRVLDGEAAEVAGLRFAGGTLWDDPESWPAGIPRLGAPDPGAPSGEPVEWVAGGVRRRATRAEIGAEHERTMAAIAAAQADVVLTHYPPSDRDLARLGRPTVWLHGHLHTIHVRRQGPHDLVRIPCRHDIGLAGAVVGIRGGGRPPEVRPVVGFGRGTA